MNEGTFEQFIYVRTYARWLEDEQRRERWAETVERYRNYFLDRFDLSSAMKVMFNDACNMILQKEIVPSMRALWTAGAALDQENICAYNCTAILIDSIKSFADQLYLLMNGCGVGYSVERQVIANLPEVPAQLSESERVVVFEDSKLGWAEGLLEYMTCLYDGIIPKYDLSLIRPKGTRLKTFGGKAGGSEDLKLLLDYLKVVFRKAQGRRLTSLECHDICCFIANVVVSAGVRRSACISLSNLSDQRMRDCKVGEFWLTHPQRAMANNSVAYTEKPDMHIFMKEWMSLMDSGCGERGIFNREGMEKTFKKIGRKIIDDEGNKYPILVNPCVTGDTMLLTDEGYFPIKDLVGHEVSVWNGREFSDVVPFSTGNNPIYHVELSNGVSIDCTGYHNWMISNGITWHEKTCRKKTIDLKVGDKLMKYDMPAIDNGIHEDPNIMYSRGFYAGDGNEGYTWSWLYIPKYCCGGRLIGTVSEEHKTSLNNESHRKWWKHGYMGNKFDVPINSTIVNKLEWLAGLLDADGSVYHNLNSDALQINSVQPMFLRDIQLMLTTLGIQCKIISDRPAHLHTFVGVNGKKYVSDCKASEKLIIAATDTAKLIDMGLHCSRLKIKKTSPNRDARHFITVLSVDDMGYSEETFCVTEPKNHTATFNGVVTGQCGELPLRPDEACNLAECIIRPDDTYDDLLKKVKGATVLGCMQSCLTDFHFLDPSWKKNMEEERLLGVSLTGVRDHPILNNVNQVSSLWLTSLRDVVHDTARVCAMMLNINMPAGSTCNKPSGSVSSLMNTASGIHTRFAPYYIRRVRVAATDVLCEFLKEKGVPNSPEVGQDEMTANTWVFEFPMKSPKDSVFDTPALEQLEYWEMFKTCWTDHNPSVTITVEEDEWLSVGAWVYKNWDIIGGLSFLPKSDNVYQLMPFEAISEEEYDKRVSEMPDIDFDDLAEFERGDTTTGAQTLACTGNNCEVY